MSDLVLEGLFDAKEVLFNRSALDGRVLWKTEGFEVELHDRQRLKELQQKYLSRKQYEIVKLINEILLELNFYEKREVLDSYPVNLQIEHTNLCNARCIMCSHSFTRNHGGKSLSEENLDCFRNILPYVRRVTLHGYGEPFVHDRIIDILSMYDSYGIKMTCNTNGSVMNTELADMIHKCFYDISVSCDAASKETYEQIRKGLSFDRFKDNIRLLRDRGSDLFMRMAVVVMRQNLQELPDIVRLAAELGFQEVVMVDLTTQQLMDNSYDNPALYPAAVRTFISRAQEVGENLGIYVKVPDYIMKSDHKRTLQEDLERIYARPMFKKEEFFDLLYEKYEESGFMELTMPATEENFVIPGDYLCDGICDFVLERPYINANGDVFLCCTNWMHIIGNIYRDGGFDAIWNGKIMRKIRSLFYEGKLPLYCTGCIFVRNDMMCSRLKVKNITEKFYIHNYDEMAGKIIEEAEKRMVAHGS